MRELNATCDKCGKITSVNFKVCPHPKTVEETYFECIHCDHHYLCFVTDYQVRAMQRRLVKLSEVEARLEMQNQINNRMDELKRELVDST